MESSRSTSIDPMSVDISVVSSGNKMGEDEFVEDSKEGVLPLVNKRNASWQNASEQKLMVWHLCDVYVLES